MSTFERERRLLLRHPHHQVNTPVGEKSASTVKRAYLEADRVSVVDTLLQLTWECAWRSPRFCSPKAVSYGIWWRLSCPIWSFNGAPTTKRFIFIYSLTWCSHCWRGKSTPWSVFWHRYNPRRTQHCDIFSAHSWQADSRRVYGWLAIRFLFTPRTLKGTQWRGWTVCLIQQVKSLFMVEFCSGLNSRFWRNPRRKNWGNKKPQEDHNVLKIFYKNWSPQWQEQGCSNGGIYSCLGHTK